VPSAHGNQRSPAWYVRGCLGDAGKHELATNASKYGSLSVDIGRIDLRWRLDGDIFTISWTERNGPPVSRPERRGLGSTVVDSMAKLSVGGEVELDYAPLGLTWRLTCPAMNAVELRRKGRNFRAPLTWAVQQVVSYLRYTGRSANVVAMAALDRNNRNHVGFELFTRIGGSETPAARKVGPSG
jgi:hypothetical protein